MLPGVLEHPDSAGGHPARARRAGGQHDVRVVECARRHRSDRRRAAAGNPCLVPAARYARRGHALPPRALPPAPMEFHAGREAVHLRFLPVSRSRSRAPISRRTPASESGAFRSRASSTAQLATGGDLGARAAAGAAAAAPRGGGRARRRSATSPRRSSRATRFASSAARWASRRAVISAHRAPDAPGGGELRLSLSSPFEPKAAEGFRCPLFPLERAGDVVTMLVDCCCAIAG